MEEQSKAATPPAPNTCRRSGRGRAALVITLVALTAGVAGGLASKAFGFGPGHWRGAGLTTAQIEQRIDRAIRHLAIEADATAEQQARLSSIANAATKDLLPLREKAMATRRQALELLTAATIDRAAIEQVRSDQLQLAEAASKRVAQALADAGDVLTADQRLKLADRLTGGPWGRWR
jgi:Spy/CpxP family protein refolding chaperone